MGLIDTHKPPLFEGELLEGSLSPVVVGEVFSADVIAPGRGVGEL